MKKLGRYIVPGDVVYWTSNSTWLVISVEQNLEYCFTNVMILGRGHVPLDTWAFGFFDWVNVL